MEFDFHKEYKNYKNAELLKIINHPGAYQPEAVEVARELLAGRGVAEAEVDEAADTLKLESAGAEDNRQEAHVPEGGLIDFTYADETQKGKIDARMWFNVFLVAIIIQYVYALYLTIRYLVLFLKYTDGSINAYTLLMLADLPLIPLMFVLFFRRNKWGWILLLSFSLLFLMPRISGAYQFFMNLYTYQGNLYLYVGATLMHGLFCYLLWQPAVAERYGITREIKKKIVIITAAAFLYSLVWTNSSMITGFFTRKHIR